MALVIISGCLYFYSQAEPVKPQTKKLVQVLESGESFLKLIDTSGNRLLMFDLYNRLEKREASLKK